MAVYLLIILTVHNLNIGNRGYVAMFWRQSYLCRSAGSVMMFSVVASNVYTFLMAYDRFLCIVWRPLLRRGFTLTDGIVADIISFVVALLLPILSLILSDKGMENSLCIPTGDSVPKTFSSLYISLTLTIFILTNVIYIAIITKIHQSIRIKSTKSTMKMTHALVRIGCIIISNLVVSLTIAILFFLTLVNINLSASAEAVVAFMILPINSCLNPLLITITTREFMTRMNVVNWHVICRSKITEMLKIILSALAKKWRRF